MNIVTKSIAKIEADGFVEFVSAARFRIVRDSYKELFNRSPRLAPTIIRMFTSFHPRFLSSDPFQLHMVDPNRITHISRLRPHRLYGVVHGGDWDKECEDLYSYPIHKSLQVYLQEGEEHALRTLFVNQVTDPDARPWGHESVDTFEERLYEIDDLIQSIEEQGYLSQRELLAQMGSEVRDMNNEPVPVELNEVTVDIGRGGELLYNVFGSHRLTIAQHLGLEKIPIIVGARHSELSRVNDLPKNSM